MKRHLSGFKGRKQHKETERRDSFYSGRIGTVTYFPDRAGRPAGQRSQTPSQLRFKLAQEGVGS